MQFASLILLFSCVLLFWNDLYCIKRCRNQADFTWHTSCFCLSMCFLSDAFPVRRLRPRSCSSRLPSAQVCEAARLSLYARRAQLLHLRRYDGVVGLNGARRRVVGLVVRAVASVGIVFLSLGLRSVRLVRAGRQLNCRNISVSEVSIKAWFWPAQAARTETDRTHITEADALTDKPTINDVQLYHHAVRTEK